MAEKRLRNWEIAGFFFTVAVGCLLHFVYEWGGERPWLGVFSSVSESTWEHMKLLYWPWFLFSMAELLVLGEGWSNLVACRAKGGLAAVVTIPVLFYTLKGALGISNIYTHLGIFVLSVAVGSFLSFRCIRRGCCDGRLRQIGGFLLMWALLFLFVYWTFAPPRLPLFIDPTTMTYGPALR